MTTLGLFVSGEEHSGNALLAQARQGEEAGFRDLLISDHYHPWNEAQGQSPFVWSVTGAIAAATQMRITTGVTCPTVRIHPAVIAQAAATMGELSKGRFRLGVGSGEALNEHILGDRWPPADVRLEMLEEAVEVMRLLWEGNTVSHHGRHYVVEDARIYTRPEQPVPVLVSGFGAKSIELAARIGDGYVTTKPDRDALGQYRKKNGRGPAIASLKHCFGPNEVEAKKLAHRLWANEQLPGELAQLLPYPAHFEQASALVTEEMVAEVVPCGPDPERHVKAITQYLEAGFDEIYVNQMGPDWAEFLKFFNDEVRPRLSL
jgi:G6PDH family F420-dependent oxidoreductase